MLVAPGLYRLESLLGSFDGEAPVELSAVFKSIPGCEGALDDRVDMCDLSALRNNVVLRLFNNRVGSVLVLKMDDGRLGQHAGDDGKSGNEESERAHCGDKLVVVSSYRWIIRAYCGADRVREVMKAGAF